MDINNLMEREFINSDFNISLSPSPNVCIVIPTFNEKDNIIELLSRIKKVLANEMWEVIFVDDNSSDRTYDFIRDLAKQDYRIRCIRRVARRGLSSACIEGMLATSAPFVAVMDADLQHDEKLLKDMLITLKKNSEIDIVVGSRYIEGGSTGNWSSERLRTSQVATKLAKVITKVEISDPMSGFFMLKTDMVHEVSTRLSAIGFKILLDILASTNRPVNCVELPYEFRERHAGESKLDNKVIWDYLMLLGDKTIGRYIPIRFISFGIVGSIGVLIHLLALSLLFKSAEISFVWAQSIATLVAMTFNFFLNNLLTYGDKQLKGFFGLMKGWMSFVAICALGAAANVGVASYLFIQDTYWIFSALAGIAVGVVWNYAVSSAYTWKGHK